jgi:hypothetical protein
MAEAWFGVARHRHRDSALSVVGTWPSPALCIGRDTFTVSVDHASHTVYTLTGDNLVSMIDPGKRRVTSTPRNRDVVAGAGCVSSRELHSGSTSLRFFLAGPDRLHAKLFEHDSYRRSIPLTPIIEAAQ